MKKLLLSILVCSSAVLFCPDKKRKLGGSNDNDVEKVAADLNQLQFDGGDKVVAPGSSHEQLNVAMLAFTKKRAKMNTIPQNKSGKQETPEQHE